MAAVRKTVRRTVPLNFDASEGAKAVVAFSRAAARLRGKAARIALPVETAARLAEVLEDTEDAAIARERAGTANIPQEVVDAVVDGTNRLRAWRKARGLTIQQLSEAAGVPVSYLSEIETGKKPGSVAAYKALAKALNADLDTLVSE